MDTTSNNLEVTSPAFEDGQYIPAKFTCDGENINFPIHIDGLPENTISLAIIIEDPDAPNKTFDHWVVWNIEPSDRLIGEHTVPGVQGKNSYGKFGYSGPCPPKGSTHRYFIKAFALDINLEISGADTYKEDLLHAMEGHIIAVGQMIGKYLKKI